MRAAEHAAVARNRQMIATGSVRGKCCVWHAGQSRRQPASTAWVAEPQFGQKRWRVCQLSSALPSASGGRWSASIRPRTAIERRSVTSKALSVLSAVTALGLNRNRKPWRTIDEAQKGGFRGAHKGTRLGPGKQRIEPSFAFLSTIISPPIT